MLDQPFNAESALPKPGDQIDRFEVITEVARGGMAAVFAARRSGIGGFDKILALKVVLPNLAGERQALERFLDEARIASLISHPNVVQVLDVGEYGRLPYMVMEFLRGQSLSAVSRKAKQAQRRLPLPFRLAVLARAAEGLAAAHRTRGSDGELLRLVHRDVSPQNIHVGYEGDVKVVDFGIAAARGRLADTRSGEFRGKLAYAAPEQMTARSPVDARTDVWALGVVSWELLSGKRLFRGEDDAQTIYKVLGGEVPDLAALVPELPREVRQLVMSCLQRDPALRPADCDQLADAFDKAALQLGGGRRSDVARYMGELFQTDRAVEDERLAAAQRGGAAAPPLTSPDPAGGSLTALSSDSRRHRRTPARLAAVVLLLSCGVAAGGLLFLSHHKASTTTREAAANSASGTPPGSSPAQPLASSAPSVSAAPQPSKPITVRVPHDARLVMVDGVRHAERPVVIQLPESGKSKLVVLPRKGDPIERRLTSSDDGITIEPPPKRRHAAPLRHRPHSSSAPATPLMGDPY